MLIFRLLVFSSLLLPLAGCRQGEGDRCQLESDCQEGLTCVIRPPPEGSRAEGGTCQLKSGQTPIDAGGVDVRQLEAFPAEDMSPMTDGPAPDLAVEQDLAAAGPDLSVELDLATGPDLSVELDLAAAPDLVSMD